MSEPVLSFRKVTKRFGPRVAVEDVDLTLAEGTTLGIVGESGSGKTTCVRLAIGLDRPTAGTVLFRDRRYPRSRRGLSRIRRRIGLVQQDPYDSLDPRMKIGDIVAEPLWIHGERGREVSDRVTAALDSVGLPNASLGSHPRAYSGGGRQRIAIARALVLEPEVLLCDEPTASLDVSVQAQIVNLLLDLRESRNLSMMFVSHDLDVIRRVATDIVVMYAGRIVETGPATIVAERPEHPYTAALLASIPGDDPKRRKVVQRRAPATSSEGAVEMMDPMRDACVFAPRCAKAQDVCRTSAPPLTTSPSGVSYRCYFPEGSSTPAGDQTSGTADHGGIVATQSGA